MTALCSLAFVVNYIDRTTLSVALPFMSKDLRISPALQGFTLSAFFITYALSQLPMGALIDRFGVKRLFGLGALWWGAVTMLTALVRSGAGLVGFRLALGVGESAAYPGSAKVVSRWFPRTERALANSIWDNGSRIGAVLALPLVTGLIAWLGWRSAFVVTGALAMLWVGLWFRAYREPREHPRLTREELVYIEAGGALLEDPKEPAGSRAPAIPWRQLFRYRTVWAMMLGFFCLNWVIYFFITWFPTYLVDARHFSLVKLGFFGTIPGLVAICGSLAGGYTADRLVRRGWPLTRARKACLVSGMLASSVIAFAVVVPAAWMALALLSVSYASLAFAAASVASLPADVAPGPQYVSSLAGIQNFASNLAGISGPLIIGVLLVLSHGSFTLPLGLAGVIAVVGALTYGLLLRRVEPLPPLSVLPPAGWYGDPAGGNSLRWWDGTCWTSRTTSAVLASTDDPAARASGASATVTATPTGPDTGFLAWFERLPAELRIALSAALVLGAAALLLGAAG
jgi:ACS family glucarate transporter-like MFS transporter